MHPFGAVLAEMIREDGNRSRDPLADLPLLPARAAFGTERRGAEASLAESEALRRANATSSTVNA